MRDASQVMRCKGRAPLTLCFAVMTVATVVADEKQPSNLPDPVADRHGDTFDGVKITFSEKKFDSGVTNQFIEGIRGADGSFTRHGWTIIYYETGHKRSKTLWRNGEPDGPRFTWYHHGRADNSHRDSRMAFGRGGTRTVSGLRGAVCGGGLGTAFTPSGIPTARSASRLSSSTGYARGAPSCLTSKVFS